MGMSAPVNGGIADQPCATMSGGGLRQLRSGVRKDVTQRRRQHDGLLRQALGRARTSAGYDGWPCDAWARTARTTIVVWLVPLTYSYDNASTDCRARYSPSEPTARSCSGRSRSVGSGAVAGSNCAAWSISRSHTRRPDASPSMTISTVRLGRAVPVLNDVREQLFDGEPELIGLVDVQPGLGGQAVHEGVHVLE